MATSDASEAYTTFSGVTRMKQGISPAGTYLDGTSPDPGLNRSATVAVTSRMCCLLSDLSFIHLTAL